MSSYLSQEHPTTSTDPWSHSTPLPRRQTDVSAGGAWSKQFVNSAQTRTLPITKRSTFSTPLVVEETEARAADGQTSKLSLPQVHDGRPALYPRDEEDQTIFEGGARAGVLEESQQTLVTRQETAIIVPFSKRAEYIYHKTEPKQPRELRQQETPTRNTSRRLSTTTRSGRSPSTVLRAVRLDCNFWTGLRPEDRLTEQAIKTGYFEKAPILNETNTAKPSLLPHLRNGTGIQGLSAFFGLVLQKREENGRVTAASTFKPPPRVTLTDTKKETWLRDLANASVPLRRLSRTIPHGVRGKSLLEQCLVKNVPTTRAVWLARCVGANELRAFRRKGISGAIMVDNEAKWVKEWTGLVETFVQECVDRREQSDWKVKVTYAVRLTSSFYVEGLLDREHFLDWLLNNLETCGRDMLLLSLVLLQPYWTDLTASWKYGSRLAEGCFRKFSDLTNLPHPDLYDVVTKRLQLLIRTLALKNSPCCLFPESWRRYSHAIGAAQVEADLETRLALQKVAARNSRLTPVFDRLHKLQGVDAIIDILDAVKTPVSLRELSRLCLSTAKDLQQNVQTTIQWATSSYRTGVHRIYLIITLFRDWSSQDLDVNTCILHTLSSLRMNRRISQHLLSRFVAELVRCRTFDGSRYLRWLIATGALGDCHADDRYLPCDVQILIDLPCQYLPPNCANLRQMLLRGIGVNTMEAEQTSIKLYLERLVMNARSEGRGEEILATPQRANEPICFAFAVSDIIRGRLLKVIGISAARHASVDYGAEHLSNNPAPELALSLRILEALDDYPILNSIFRALAKITDMSLLTSIARSLEGHLDAFDAITPAWTLCAMLIARYRTLRHTSPPLKAIAEPLLRICTRLSSDPVVMAYLEQELVISEQSIALAACTPVSDVHIENSGLEYEEDIEQFLAAITVEARAIARVCEIVSSRMGRIRKGPKLDLIVIRPMISRLRASDEFLFDSLVRKWAFARTEHADATSLARLSTILVDAGCIVLPSLVHWAEDKCTTCAKQDLSKAAEIAIDILTMLIPLPGTETVHQDQLRFCKDDARILIRFLSRSILLDEGRSRPSSTSRLQALLSNAQIFLTMNVMLLRDSAAFYSEFDLVSLVTVPSTLARVRNLVFQLLDPNDQLDFSHMSTELVVHSLFENLDVFSLPAHQFGLSFFALASRHAQGEQVIMTTTTIEAVKAAMARNCTLWPKLIATLDISVVKEIRERAESVLLNSFVQTQQPGEPGEGYVGHNPQVEREKYLNVIEATSASLPEGGDCRVAQAISNTLDTLTQDTACDDAFNRSRTLLRMAVIHRRSFQNATLGSVDRARFLCTLCRFFTNGNVKVNSDIVEYAFDVAAYFAIDVTSRELSYIRDALGPLVRDSRVSFLFGFRPPANGWLHVTSSLAGSEQEQEQPSAPFQLRPWELLPDATPNVGVNDTAVSLRLFNARRV